MTWCVLLHTAEISHRRARSNSVPLHADCLPKTVPTSIVVDFDRRSRPQKSDAFSHPTGIPMRQIKKTKDAGEMNKTKGRRKKRTKLNWRTDEWIYEIVYIHGERVSTSTKQFLVSHLHGSYQRMQGGRGKGSRRSYREGPFAMRRRRSIGKAGRSPQAPPIITDIVR